MFWPKKERKDFPKKGVQSNEGRAVIRKATLPLQGDMREKAIQDWIKSVFCLKAQEMHNNFQ